MSAPKSGNTRSPNHNRSILDFVIKGRSRIDNSLNDALVTAEGFLAALTVTSQKLIWQTITNFNTGTHTNTIAETLSPTEAVHLDSETDLNDDIDYETAGEYDVSSAPNIEVAAGVGRLVQLTGTSNDWPFTTPGNYTYDSAKIEVTGGVAQLIDVFPGTFYASYNVDVDGDEGDGVLTGTAVGGASVSGGKLDLKGETKQHVHYDATDNADHAQQGAVRFKLTPNYNGKPGSWQAFFVICKADSDIKNRIEMRHSPSAGQLQFRINDQNGSSIGTFTLANWLPNGGQEYEMEFNYDFDGNASRLFIDGVQHGSTMATLGVRNASEIDFLAVGRDYNDNETANFEVADFAVFDSVQHTSDYTPLGSPPWDNYPTDNPTIVPTSGFVFTTAINSFTETATKPSGTAIQYHVSDDNGTTWYYWTGAAWAVTDDTFAQSNDAATINTNISSLASSGTFLFRALLNSDGSDTPQLDNVQVTDTPSYSTTDDLYIDTKDTSQIDTSSILSFVSADITNVLPASTDIRVLVSTNDRASWLTWNGSAWAAPTSATDRDDATSITDFENNITSLTPGSTFDIRVFLQTSDSSTTPQILNINVIGDTGFKTSGNWESAVYNSATLSQTWKEILFNTNVPAGTSITVEARAGNDSDLSSVAYSGPFSNDEDTNLTGQYIQVKVTFAGTATARADLIDIAIKFSTSEVVEVGP